MADKYIIHGATYNGDGTTSSEAASNGAAGAWNTITYFEGTSPAYGSIADGDTVYIRGKDASGSDITRTIAANTVLGLSGLTTSSVGVHWVFDNGTTWSGVTGGVLTYKRTAGNYTLAVQSFNRVTALDEDAFVASCEYTLANAAYMVDLVARSGVVLDNVRIRLDAVGTRSSGGPQALRTPDSAIGVFNNLRIDAGVKFYVNLIYIANYARQIFNNLTVNLDYPSSSVAAVFYMGYYGSSAAVFGGRVQGAYANSAGCALLKNGNSHKFLELYGVDVPKDFPLTLSSESPLTHYDSGILALGLDDGLGAVIRRLWGQADSRSTNNYPTLNAAFPTSTPQPWSWRLQLLASTFWKPAELPLHEVYTDTAAAVTITVNLLVADTISDLHQGNLWLDVIYVDDATGKAAWHTSYVQGNTSSLDTSTAAWSATTWGAISLDKYQLQITTPTDVKQDTMIMVILRCSVAYTSSADILFVCPQPVLS